MENQCSWGLLLGIAGIKKPAPGAPVRIVAWSDRLGFGLHLENLTATVHAGLQVNVVRTAQLAGILVLDVGRGLQGIGGATHAAPRRRRFSLWNGHNSSPVKIAERPLNRGTLTSQT